jgi:hypothetical protein
MVIVVSELGLVKRQFGHRARLAQRPQGGPGSLPLDLKTCPWARKRPRRTGSPAPGWSGTLWAHIAFRVQTVEARPEPRQGPEVGIDAGLYRIGYVIMEIPAAGRRGRRAGKSVKPVAER